ncbi:MAG: OsmC family peroxiredoxin [Euzebyales bacterium]|jgi:osmotically inducible protein OsmC|nr:OsmC family peroxiredoxin [Euzebyales bacterium]
MAADSKASVTWQGDIKTGTGVVSLDSSQAAGPLDVTFPARTGEQEGPTTPEELIAAAHATCYSMSLSGALARSGNAPDKLDTSAVVTFSTDGGPHISKVALSVVGEVPGVDAEAFGQAAAAAKDACPVSKLMAGNVELTLDARLA